MKFLRNGLLLVLFGLGLSLGCASDRPHRPILHPDYHDHGDKMAIVTSQTDPFLDLREDAYRVQSDVRHDDFSRWNPVPAPAKPNAKLY
jgi:hypothetical protein